MRHIGTLTIAAITLAGLTILSTGCGKDTSPTPSTTDAAITQKTCPVMGGAIDPLVLAEHQGRKVYFCCKECIKPFQKDPAKYLSKLATTN